MTSGHRAFQQHAKRAEGSVDANGNIIKGAARLTGPIFTGSQTDVTFTDNQYHIVQNDVTIHGNLTIGGEGGLVLCAGATLTVNGALIHNGGRVFHIYGQTLTESGKDTGKLVINNSNGGGAAIRTTSTSTSKPQLSINSGELEIRSQLRYPFFSPICNNPSESAFLPFRGCEWCEEP